MYQKKENSTYGEHTKFYNEFKGHKCKYGTFLSRLWKGIEIKRAIKPFNLHVKGRQDDIGKTCPQCMKFKLFSSYYYSRSELNGRDSCCSDCRKEQRRKQRSNSDTRLKENLRKKEYNKRPDIAVKIKLDSLFYMDKLSMRNRKIIKSIRKIKREESRESKLQYLFYHKGISVEKLKKVYGDFGNEVLSIKSSDY